ncbi:MAG TPA: hypothetical protein VKB78_04920 [Pirellulales bacterium]|nr:hypothetical protein [Pirellulales bacterium]
MTDAPEATIPRNKTSFMADPLWLVSEPAASKSHDPKTTAEIHVSSADAPAQSNTMRIRIGETSNTEPSPTAILEFGHVTTNESSSLKVRPSASKPAEATAPTVVTPPMDAPKIAAQPNVALQSAEVVPAPVVETPSIAISSPKPAEPAIAEPPVDSSKRDATAVSIAKDAAGERSASPPSREPTLAPPLKDLVADGPAIAPQQTIVETPVIERPAVATAPTLTGPPKGIDVKDEIAARSTLAPPQNAVAPPVVERVNVAARPAPPAMPPIAMKIESERVELAPPERGPELMAICRKADAINRHAFELAQHGAVFSARLEYMHSLEVIAEALDAQRGIHSHERMLIVGFRAMEEADDFASQHFLAAGERTVADIVRSHQTPVVRNETDLNWTTQAAMSRYLTYSQEQLAGALANLPPASAALFGLGKIYTVPPAAHGPPDATGGAKAVGLYQAALMVDGRNYLAANELGVLLAGFGRLPEARAALLHSLSVSSQPIVWQNLAAVHRAMGEADLAARAGKEAELAANRMGQAAATAYDVHWVDPETFARAKPIDADPVNSATNPAANSTSASTAPAASKSVAGSVSWGAGRK